MKSILTKKNDESDDDNELDEEGRKTSEIPTFE